MHVFSIGYLGYTQIALRLRNKMQQKEFNKKII